MKISPPIAVLTIAAVGIAATVWLVPAQSGPQPNVKLSLPAATYDRLALWAADHPDQNGGQLTTAQVIEELVSRYPRKREIPENRMGPRVK